MPLFTDQLHRTISILSPPKRIVSLVPSQTELLATLGLDAEVVGITKFCVHPEDWFRKKTRIGGTKNVHIEQVTALHPDLIIANKEENVQEQVEALAEKFPVWVSDVNNLEEALQMIQGIGNVTSRNEKADQVCLEIKTAFANLPTMATPLRMAYLIWQDPYMTIGGDTFLHHMLEQAGFQNCFANRQRYPAITLDDLRNCQCEVVLLSSEPYPFKEKHAAELAAQLPGKRLVLVDGEMFSWYGSRLLQAPAYLRSLQIDLMA